MKIIDNKRDYYDFVVGKYGMDEGVVFDRRGSYILAKTESDVLRKYFSTERSEEDKPRRKDDGRRSRYWYPWRYDDRYDFLVLEVGFGGINFRWKGFWTKTGRYTLMSLTASACLIARRLRSCQLLLFQRVRCMCATRRRAK